MKADTHAAGIPAPKAELHWRDTAMQILPFLAIFGFAAIVPMITNDYWALIATRAAIYWVLVSGLNLIVGFA
jgi:ABC-type branched-subunit amino acid transport system permease subunit